jgi:hypothetical protein
VRLAADAQHRLELHAIEQVDAVQRRGVQQRREVDARAAGGRGLAGSWPLQPRVDGVLFLDEIGELGLGGRFVQGAALAPIPRLPSALLRPAHSRRRAASSQR